MEWNESQWNEWSKWIDENEAEIRLNLSATNDQIGESRRLEGMIRDRFTSLPEGLTPQSVADGMIKNVVEELRLELAELRREVKTIAKRPTTINQFNVTDSIIKAPLQVINPPAAKPARRQNLKFYFIRDDALTIKDRIVYAYLRKLDRLEADGKQPTRTWKRLATFTGYHRLTVQQSIKTLLGLGYVDENWRVLKTEPKGIPFIRDCDDAILVREVMEKNQKRGRYVGASWAAKAFGISRATFYRWTGSQNETRKESE